MAGDAVIGALRVTIGADSAALTKGLNDARGKLQEFGSQVATAGAVIATAMTAAFAGLSVSVSNAVEKMADVGKVSQKIGVPVDQLSALSLAADMSGVSMDQLQVGLGKLSKSMTEAAAKPTSEAANAFRALGVQVTDANGQLLPVLSVTEAMATKFAGANDGAAKTAISMALLGKSGAELIPLLNQGGDGLQQMMLRAQQLGVAFDKNASDSAKKFTDSLKLMAAAKDGIITRLAVNLLPLMQAFADRMVNAATNTDKQNSKVSLLTNVMTALGKAMLLVVDNFSALLKVGAVFVGAQIASAALGMIVAFVNLAKAVQAAGLMMAAFEAIRAIGTRGILLITGLVALATGQFENLTAALKTIGDKIGQALPSNVGEGFRTVIKALGFDLSALDTQLTTTAGNGKKNLTELSYSALAGKDAFDKFIDSQQKSIAAAAAQFAAVGMASGAHERLKVVLEGLAVAQQTGKQITDQQTASLTAAANAAELMALKLGNAQLIGQTNPFAALQANLDATNLKLQQGGLALQDYATLSMQAAQLQSKVWSEAGTSLAGSVDSIGSSLSQMSGAWGRMAQVGKAVGAAIAFINSYVAASQALATAVFPANIAIAAGVLANGLAMVAAIKSAAVPTKMALGGSFVVGGGKSMTDNTIVPMALSSGERVSVESNHNQGGSGGGGGVLEVRGLTSDAIFSGEMVRSLAKKLIDYQRFGGKVVLAPA